MSLSLTLVLLVCSDVGLSAGALALDPQVALWLELDDNAPRVPDEIFGEDERLVPPRAGEQPHRIADGLVRGEVLLGASFSRPGLLLRSDSALGLKLFFTQRSERMLVLQTRASLSARMANGGVLTLAAFGKGRGQLSGARTYGLLRSDALIDKQLIDELVLRVGASGQTLLALDGERSSFLAAGAGAIVGARLALADAESLELLIDAGGRGFPLSPKDADQRADDVKRRADGVISGTLQMTSAGRLYLSGGYLVTRNASNARGESFTRHRLFSSIGFRLPAEVTCAAQGAVQLTSYDDGVSVGRVYFLEDDEESQNVLEVMLSRPLFGGLFLEARVSFFGNELAVEGARFSRQTAAVGVRAVL